MKAIFIWLSASFLLAAPSLGLTDTVMPDKLHMTHYTFASDFGGKSVCYDACAKTWPPFLGKTGENMGDQWTLVARTDGTLQWAHEGRPVYLHVYDLKVGDQIGHGKENGKWRILDE